MEASRKRRRIPDPFPRRRVVVDVPQNVVDLVGVKFPQFELVRFKSRLDDPRKRRAILKIEGKYSRDGTAKVELYLKFRKSADLASASWSAILKYEDGVWVVVKWIPGMVS